MNIIDETNFTTCGSEISRGRLVLGDHLPDLPVRFNVRVVVWCHQGEASVVLDDQRRSFASGDLLFITPASLLSVADLSRCQASVVYVSRAPCSTAPPCTIALATFCIACTMSP